jgi:hypothetical protein
MAPNGDASDSESAAHPALGFAMLCENDEGEDQREAAVLTRMWWATASGRRIGAGGKELPGSHPPFRADSTVVLVLDSDTGRAGLDIDGVWGGWCFDGLLQAADSHAASTGASENLYREFGGSGTPYRVVFTPVVMFDDAHHEMPGACC